MWLVGPSPSFGFSTMGILERPTVALAYLQGRPVDLHGTVQYRRNLVEVLSLLDRLDEARVVAEELVQEKPPSVDYLGFLGTLAARMSQREEAVVISDQLSAMHAPSHFPGDETAEARPMGALSEPLGLTLALQRALLVVVTLGFPVSLVLAWYHREEGRQRVTGIEFSILALLLIAAWAALSLVEPFGGGDDDRPSIAVLSLRNLTPDPRKEGSARTAGDSVWITGRLIEGASDHQVWAETVQRIASDLRVPISAEDNDSGRTG